LLAALPALAVLWYLDRRERESIWVFVGLLLWGAWIAAAYALLLNTSGGLALTQAMNDDAALKAEIESAGADVATVGDILVAWLIAPPVEEIMKGLAILLIFLLLRSEFDGVRDGIIYGALVGLGFNVMETAQYITVGYAQMGYAPYMEQIVTRFVFLGLDGHSLYSALFGAGLGLAMQTRRLWLKVLAPVGGLMLGILAHFVNNSLTAVAFVLLLQAFGVDVGEEAAIASVPLLLIWFSYAIAVLLTQFPFYFLIAIALVFSDQWEQRVIRKELADEIDRSITQEEYELLRRESLFGLRTVPGFPGPVARSIVNAQNELAFRKWRVKCYGGDPELDDLVHAWRADITRLRAFRAS
ncbi:MAG TPA: PrsW family intramembrane metalloprotease, partial [Methanotrichaceae archaeon]|nr:PrsW family intramembrane metalloprotease [Methanotrichaceae archaeon]